MAVMSPQLSASTHPHDPKSETAAPALAEADNAVSQGTMAMDLDVNGTVKQSTTSSSIPEFAPSSPKDEPIANDDRDPLVNGNSTAKKINAPPSPPIPTPPLHQTDSSQELSDLHITSPAGGAPSMSFRQTNLEEGPKTRDKAIVEDVRKEAKITERTNGATNDRSKSSTHVSTADHAMTDAPSVKTSREREDDDNVGPPLKRAKTEEMDSSSSSVEAPPYHTTDSITPSQIKFVLGVIRSLRRTKDARPFTMPVDAERLNVPTYYEIVTNPMDLQTMEKKLQNNEYKNPRAIVDDFNLILSNCVLFNSNEHPVTDMSKSMQASWEKHMKGFPAANAPEVVEKSAPKPSKKKGGSRPSAAKAPKSSQVKKEAKAVAQSPIAASPTFGLQPSGIPQIRRDSTAGDGRPKREIHPPAPKDLPYSDVKPRRKKNASELKFCDMVIKELHKKIHEPYAFPFYSPVDPVALNIPEYFKIIKKPMDLGTIQSKLKTNQYESGNDFEADLRLMFRNCYKFNPPNQAVHQMGKRLEGIFDEKWSDRAKYIRDNPGSHSPASASPPPEDHDEDEMSEEEEPNQPDIKALEQQLEMMKDQLSSLKRQNKKTPPVSSNSKKGKAGPSRKNSTAAAPAPPAKKVKRSGNKKDVPYITLEQKTELSERINFLPSGKMAYALNMIRQNMPEIDKGQNDEIELDIDELDPQTLYKLYAYVSKYTPALEAKYVPPPPPPRPAQESKAKTKAPSKPRKNKPMSASEQEAKIKDLTARLHDFDNPTPLPSSAQAAPENADSESSDDDESSGSESEEE
ncbi:Bromodomain-containing protein [Morchella snyderi]|nr:Bromodomain-containing protein [Morchella snyderi]